MSSTDVCECPVRRSHPRDRDQLVGDLSQLTRAQVAKIKRNVSDVARLQQEYAACATPEEREALRGFSDFNMYWLAEDEAITRSQELVRPPSEST